MKKVLISTGGSGGHVLPSLSLYDHLKNNFEVYLTTDKRGSNFINKKYYNYDLLNVPNIYSKLILFPINIFLFFFCIFKSFNYFKKKKIDFLISTGGYMSLPFCIAAKFLGIRIILYEPNSILGRSNKFILKNCSRILCYYEDILNFPEDLKFKIVLIQPLLREQVYNCQKNLSKNLKSELRILILGGSQGAKFFDDLMSNVIIKLSIDNNIKVMHQIHDVSKLNFYENKYNQAGISNKIFNFNPNISDQMGKFNLAITRCGASSLAELTYLNLPFIGVPFPYAKDNHQYHNVKKYVDHNCCWILEQKNITTDIICELIINIRQNIDDYDEKKHNMHKISYQNSWNNVNKKLIDLINEH